MGGFCPFAHGTSHSAGVLVLFNRFPGSIIDHKGDTEGRWLMLVVEMDDKRYILICIYGSNNKAVNANLYAKRTYSSDKVIMGRDLNTLG